MNGNEENYSKEGENCSTSWKVMATDFWDSQCAVLTDYLQEEKTVNGEYYAALLEQLKDAIKANRPNLA